MTNPNETAAPFDLEQELATLQGQIDKFKVGLYFSTDNSPLVGHANSTLRRADKVIQHLQQQVATLLERQELDRGLYISALRERDAAQQRIAELEAARDTPNTVTHVITVQGGVSVEGLRDSVAEMIRNRTARTAP